MRHPPEVFPKNALLSVDIDDTKQICAERHAFGGFPFIEKLKIYNGKAYFLYANDYTNNKRLYEVAIE